MGGATTARLMLYSQSYKILHGLDEGTVYAYNQFFRNDFLIKYKELNDGLGPIKNILIEMFSS